MSVPILSGLQDFVNSVFHPGLVSPIPQDNNDASQIKLTMVHNPNVQFEDQAAPTQAPVQSFVNSASPDYQGLGRNPDLPKKPMAPEVKSAIQNAAQEFGVNPQLMFDIGYSEGGFRPDAKNQSPEGQAVGVPEGLFQFTPGTWNNDLANYAKSTKTSFSNFSPSASRSDPVANARAAAYLISHGQLQRWEASRPNWGRFYSDKELAPYYSQSGQ